MVPFKQSYFQWHIIDIFSRPQFISTQSQLSCRFQLSNTNWFISLPNEVEPFFFFLLYALILHVIVIFQLYVLIVLCFIVSMSDFWQYSARRSILYCTIVVWSHCSFLYVRLEVSMLLGSLYQRFITLFTHMCRDIHSRYLVCTRINHVSI